jgi:hypothetical protein
MVTLALCSSKSSNLMLPLTLGWSLEPEKLRFAPLPWLDPVNGEETSHCFIGVDVANWVAQSPLKYKCTLPNTLAFPGLAGSVLSDLSIFNSEAFKIHAFESERARSGMTQVPIKCTMKSAVGEDVVAETPPRDELFAVADSGGLLTVPGLSIFLVATVVAVWEPGVAERLRRRLATCMLPFPPEHLAQLAEIATSNAVLPDWFLASIEALKSSKSRAASAFPP